MVKVFTTNNNGKIEFTKEELENLLNEVWNDGYNKHGSYWWTSPTIATPYYSEITTASSGDIVAYKGCHGCGAKMEEGEQK